MRDSSASWIVEVLERLRGYAGKDSMVEFNEYCAEIHDRIRPVTYYTGTMPILDGLSAGFQEGEQVIIGGATNEGKTLLILSLIDAFEKQGLVSAFFSFEQTVEQIAEKFNYEPPAFYVPRRIDYEVKYDPFIEKLKRNSQTFLGSLPSAQLQWIYLKLLEMTANGRRPNVIFIDYLHVLMGRGRENAVWALGSVMIALKQMALQLKLIVFIVCHTTKESLKQEEPNLGDLRDSGWIANAPDVVLLVWRVLDKHTKEPTDISILKIAKHRRKGKAKNRKIELVMNDRGLLEELGHKEGFNAASSY